MKLIAWSLIAVVLQGGIVELLGPAGRRASRLQQSDRGDGTGQFLELAMFSVAGTSGAARLQIWTSRRDNGQYSRTMLQERELQIPEPLRIAKELYDFPPANFENPNAALAENRVAVLCGGAEFTLRMVSIPSLALGRAISLPAQARQLAIRPGSGEVWVTHAGSQNQVSISDPLRERVVATVPLRLSPQAVPVSLHMSSSGRTAYVVARNPDSATDRGFVILIDTVSRQIRSTVSLGTNSPQSAVLSPDGSTIYIAGTSLNDLNVAEPSMVQFDTLTNSASVAALELGVAAEQIVIHPNGRRIFWWVPRLFALDEYDVQARRIVRRISLTRLTQPMNLEFTPGGDVLILRDSEGQLAAHLDAETGETLDTQAIPAGPGVSLLRP
jgi:hypothetical protein